MDAVIDRPLLTEVSLPRVFVVDDDRLTCQLISKLLAKEGYATVAHTSARDFLHSYQDDPASSRCLITDVCMPDLSGHDLQAILVRHGIALPIVFLTGYGSVESAVASLQAGACDFLQKPVHVERLKACVARVMEQEAQRSEQARQQKRFVEQYQTLTLREKEVLDLLMRDIPTKRIASQLGISIKTVFVHRARILEKLRVDNLVELYLLVKKAGHCE